MSDHKHEHDNARSLKDNVLGAIRTNSVRMRPRWHFVLRAALSVTGLALAALFAVYLVSLAIFILRLNGGWFATSFGTAGLRVFLLGIPWAVVIIAIVFLVVVQLLVKHYSFAYRRPLLYSVIAIVAIVAIGGFAVARTGFHRELLSRARDERLPVAGAIYRRLELMRPERLYRGIITETGERGFWMTERDGEFLEVVVRRSTRTPRGWSPSVDQPVVVVGERVDDAILAEGVMPIRDDAGLPRPGRAPGMRRILIIPAE